MAQQSPKSTMDDRRWTIDDRRSTMDDRRWTIDDGRSTMDDPTPQRRSLSCYRRQKCFGLHNAQSDVSRPPSCLSGNLRENPTDKKRDLMADILHTAQSCEPRSDAAPARVRSDSFSNNFRRRMGSNSLQGWAILAMLVAFTALSLSFYLDGSILWMLVFVVAMGSSIALFLKAKPMES